MINELKKKAPDEGTKLPLFNTHCDKLIQTLVRTVKMLISNLKLSTWMEDASQCQVWTQKASFSSVRQCEGLERVCVLVCVAQFNGQWPVLSRPGLGHRVVLWSLLADEQTSHITVLVVYNQVGQTAKHTHTHTKADAVCHHFYRKPHVSFCSTSSIKIALVIIDPLVCRAFSTHQGSQ